MGSLPGLRLECVQGAHHRGRSAAADRIVARDVRVLTEGGVGACVEMFLHVADVADIHDGDGRRQLQGGSDVLAQRPPVGEEDNRTDRQMTAVKR